MRQAIGLIKTKHKSDSSAKLSLSWLTNKPVMKLLQHIQPEAMSVRTQVPSQASLSGLRIWHWSPMQLGSGLPWLWHRPAAKAPIQPLAWKLPYAAGAALKKQKQKKL